MNPSRADTKPTESSDPNVKFEPTDTKFAKGNVQVASRIQNGHILAQVKKGKRRSFTDLSRDPMILKQIPWSEYQTPDMTLQDRIRTAEDSFRESNAILAKWQKAGRPRCYMCYRIHPGPCLDSDSVLLYRVRKDLLAEYRERKAFQANLPAPSSEPGVFASALVPPKDANVEPCCERCDNRHKQSVPCAKSQSPAEEAVKTRLQFPGPTTPTADSNGDKCSKFASFFNGLPEGDEHLLKEAAALFSKVFVRQEDNQTVDKNDLSKFARFYNDLPHDMAGEAGQLFATMFGKRKVPPTGEYGRDAKR